LVNANSIPQAVQIDLSGAATIAGSATLVTLSGANPAETNTIAAPTRIAPIKTVLKDIGPTFNHTVPGYAVQVLEISAK
jgi:alpha-N-arabinofuranosidase